MLLIEKSLYTNKDTNHNINVCWFLMFDCNDFLGLLEQRAKRKKMIYRKNDCFWSDAPILFGESLVRTLSKKLERSSVHILLDHLCMDLF